MDYFVGGYVVEETRENLGPDSKILIWWSKAIVSMPVKRCTWGAAVKSTIEICRVN
jgi:hypothetical protein